MPLDHPILNDHGVFYPRGLSHNLTFEITLALSSDVVITTDITKPYSYSLSNLEFEFETITSRVLAHQALSNYKVGMGFFCKNVLLHKTVTI